MVQVANRTKAVEKLESIIKEGRTRTTTAIEGIQREWESRRDLFVPADKLDFDVDDRGVHPVVSRSEVERQEFDLTTHAYRQVLDRTGVPKPFADRLHKLGEFDLLQENLRTLFRRQSPTGALVRHVGGTVKGFLSTAYRTMDAAPIFEGLASEAIARGFVPYRGFNTDTRMGVTFLYPRVFEPTYGEFVVFGISQTTGDYGGVANTLELMALRIFCDNLAVGFDIFRKVHIGKRFADGEEGVIEISRVTRELDQKTIVSATKDAVRSAVRYFEPLNEAISGAADRDAKVGEVLKSLRKRGIRKEIVEQVENTFGMDMPVEALPSGTSAWRLSNVLSLIAKTQDGDDRLGLEAEAFNVLDIPDLKVA